MIRRLFLLCLTLFLSSALRAQQPAEEEIGFLYRKEAVGGIIVHTNGWGGSFRYGIQKTYTQKLSFGFDLVSMRHPKEIKVYNPNFDDGKGYYYGKLNSVLVARPSIGYRRVLFQKKREQGVEVGFNVAVGPSLALARPVYLQVLYPTNDPFSFAITDEKYDPDKHFAENIYGRSRGLRGFGETKIHPGGFVKFGFHFEYSSDEERIRAIETGMVLDVYPQKVPIMATEDNRFYFLTLYVNIIFGRKYF